MPARNEDWGHAELPSSRLEAEMLKVRGMGHLTSCCMRQVHAAGFFCWGGANLSVYEQH